MVDPPALPFQHPLIYPLGLLEHAGKGELFEGLLAAGWRANGRLIKGFRPAWPGERANLAIAF